MCEDGIHSFKKFNWAYKTIYIDVANCQGILDLSIFQNSVLT